MKTVFAVLAALSIVLSATMLHSSNSRYFCSAEIEHTQNTECSNCHVDTHVNIVSEILPVIVSPQIIGQIFFNHINISHPEVTFTFDRPPILNA